MKSPICSRLLPVAIVIALAPGIVGRAHAQDAAPSPIPAETPVPSSVPVNLYKVVLLPVINQSGEKDLRQRRDQATKGNEELAKLFRERGFEIVSSADVDQALTRTGIDLTDEENYNRATLFRIADELKADLIVFVLIEDVQQVRGKVPFNDDQQELVARVRTKTWLLNNRTHTPILNAVRQESQSKNSFTAAFDSGARRLRNTVPGAIRDTLRSFLETYPKVTPK